MNLHLLRCPSPPLLPYSTFLALLHSLPLLTSVLLLLRPQESAAVCQENYIILPSPHTPSPSLSFFSMNFSLIPYLLLLILFLYLLLLLLYFVLKRVQRRATEMIPSKSDSSDLTSLRWRRGDYKEISYGSLNTRARPEHSIVAWGPFHSQTWRIFKLQSHIPRPKKTSVLLGVQK